MVERPSNAPTGSSSSFAGIDVLSDAIETGGGECSPTITVSDLPDRVGRYRIERMLGSGSYGCVYVARDGELERNVAIKIPHPDRISRPEDIELYLAEARILASLDHPAIVPVFDSGRTNDGLCYVVSKLVEGTDLESRVQAGRLSIRESAELVRTVAEALHHAHTHRLVHRDVKPANILLDTAGRPYLADFGLALKDSDFGSGEHFAGTPAYMSPEQARGEGHLVDGRSDVFSLGVVFYELLVGDRAYRAGNIAELLEQIRTIEPRPPRQIDDSIPRELERICLKALSRRANDRYTTALDFAGDLAAWLASEEQKQAAATLVQPPLSVKAAAALPESPSQSSRVIPRGLRAYDGADADYFLQLYPGPYDREGVPESMRFWQRRIEQTDADETFRVGLLYGPSGCGKSSVMKAGFLPILAGHVIPIYVEATTGATEARLLRALRKRFRELPERLNLSESLAQVRRGQCLAAGRKALIVIDQFEQWLHVHHEFAETELLRALRQCDGGRVQALLMVRDDFWMPVMRFMRDLEVPVSQRHNSGAVDLFDPQHARKVLAEFGRAYERLPDDLARLGDEQSRFLDRAVEALSEDGLVIPVRLSLFAEMVKGKPWAPATLEDVGGPEGLGLAFLKETFESSTAPPEHRLHQAALRRVLAALMPEAGSTLKGGMRSRSELLAASGYESRPRDFDDVLPILDNLRLITPTSPEGLSADESASSRRLIAGEQYYQLTHDYLVPSLREWLTRKQRETRRGRAELLLEERTREWSRSRRDRLLPSLGEYASVALFTRRKKRNFAERAMLRRATVMHGRRLAIGTLAVFAIAALVVALLPRSRSQSELLGVFIDPTRTALQRNAAFDRLDVTDIRLFDRMVDAVRSSDDSEVVLHALPRLVALAAEEDAPPSVRGQVADLSRHLTGHSDQVVQAAAFARLAELADASEVLRTLRFAVSDRHVDGLEEPARQFFSTLEPDQLPDDLRLAVLRDMILILRAGPDEWLSQAVAETLRGVEAQQLLTWLIKVSERHEEQTALDWLLPHMARDRIDELGRAAESRLLARVDLAAERVESSYETEFLIRALGVINPRSGLRYDEGLRVIAGMLAGRGRLDDPLILEAVIESFAALAAGGTVSAAPLREILTDKTLRIDQVQQFAVVAAAKAIGDVGEFDSIPDLIEIVERRSEVSAIGLPAAALESLVRLAETMDGSGEQPELLGRVRSCLIGVIQDPATDGGELQGIALAGFATAGNPDDCPVIYPALSQLGLTTAAIKAVLSILVRHSEQAPAPLTAYLEWAVGLEGRQPSTLDRPDRALFGFDFYLPKSDAAEAAFKAVVESLAQSNHSHDDAPARAYAARLLKNIQAGLNAPAIDPAAEETERDRQWRAWRAWWSEREASLTFSGDRLVPRRPSSAP